MGLDVSGLIECVTKRNMIYFTNQSGVMVARECTKCREIKPTEYFYKLSYGFGGVMARCKVCASASMKIYVENNKDHLKEARHKWVEKKKENPIWEDEFKLTSVNHRSERCGVIGNLTYDMYAEVGEAQGGECLLTHSPKDQCHIDHFIACDTGWATNFTSNIVIMDGSLNISKHANNPFVWIETQPTDIQNRFHQILVPILAERNHMTVETFERYVTWCYNNPLTDEEKQNRRTSWERLQQNGSKWNSYAL